MRGMKKILVLMLLCTTVVGTSKTNPTLTTLKWKSSEILSDSEGETPTFTMYKHMTSTSQWRVI